MSRARDTADQINRVNSSAADATAITVDSSENVGIGTSSPSAKLDVGGVIQFLDDNTPEIKIIDPDDSNYALIGYSDGTMTLSSNHGNEAGGANVLKMLTGGTEHMRIDSTGNVGIGATPSTDWRTAFNTTALQVGQSGSLFNLDVSNSDRRCMLSSNAILNASGDFQHIMEGPATAYSQQSETHRWYTAPSASSGATASATERMRIDSSGRVLVGKTASGMTSNGVELRTGVTNDYAFTATSLNQPVMLLNRQTDDGMIIRMRKANSDVGFIGNKTRLYMAGTDMGIYFGPTYIAPVNSLGNLRDNQYDLGDPSYRWEDIYASNGTIQTSDFNEKQDIASLTATEMLVGKRISALFKTFRWKDSVAEKGDNARTHTGVIAQDVQAAFTAEGLDAGDYALFISSTWWETQTDVPAVEAVAEVTDEDGNVTTEAVEAKDAYTRTDTYDTEAEAPEGSTSKTRMGIRYPELLSFVAAYNEQRFASIEARLTALEA